MLKSILIMYCVCACLRMYCVCVYVYTVYVFTYVLCMCIYTYVLLICVNFETQNMLAFILVRCSSLFFLPFDSCNLLFPDYRQIVEDYPKNVSNIADASYDAKNTQQRNINLYPT